MVGGATAQNGIGRGRLYVPCLSTIASATEISRTPSTLVAFSFRRLVLERLVNRGYYSGCRVARSDPIAFLIVSYVELNLLQLL